MKKKLFVAVLLMLALTLAFAITASAKDVNIGINDVNGNAIVVPTVDEDGDSLTWYRITDEPAEGTYYTYVSNNTTYYLVSVKTKNAAYVKDNYRLNYSYSGIKAGAWSGNIVVMNLKGITHADGTGPQMLDFLCEGTPIAYAYFPKSINSLQGTSGNSTKPIFYAAASLVEVEFEADSQISTLDTYNFYNCKKLKNMVLPENLTTIKTNALVGLSLELTVPKSVTTFEVSDHANLTVHFTGEKTTTANWAHSCKSIDYVSHCNVYYNGVHQAGETVDYKTNCSRCGVLVHCEDPEHNLALEISYESYLANGTKMVKCLDCNTEAKACVALPLITVNGFSTPENQGRKGITFGYTLNLASISDYEKANDVVVGCGALLAGYEKFMDGSKIVNVALTSKFSAIDIKIDFGTEESYDDYDLILAGSITVTSENSSETEYFQPITEKEATNYTSSSYGTLYGISYNGLIGA